MTTNFSNTYRPQFQQSQYQHPPPNHNPLRVNACEETMLASPKNIKTQVQAQAQAQAQIVHSHTQFIAKFESQMGLIANAMSHRNEGNLPSQPIQNPKWQFENGGTSEQVNVVSTRMTT